ncbi:MAG: hypothetical protein ACPLGZ_00040 [Candidatus Pelagibacter ubique]
MISLDERFFNKVGAFTPTSCKGEVCWSWLASGGIKGIYDWTIYSSGLPVTISDASKVSKSISQTIKQTATIRKSADAVAKAAAEMVHSSFTTGKELGISQEKAMSETKTREQETRQNITPLFHAFLARAIQGPLVAIYPFCISSAVSLFWHAYEAGKTDDLVKAFVIYRTVKPEDIDFDNTSTLLNRAKFLYSIYFPSIRKDYDSKLRDFAWASSVLFATLLEWPEFAEVAKKVDSEIQKAYGRYQTMKKHTTQGIYHQDQQLALAKWSLADTTEKPENQTALKDKYIEIATAYDYIVHDMLEGKKPQLEQELQQKIQNHDPIVTSKFIHESSVKNIPVWVLVGTIGISVALVVATIIRRRRKKNQKH